MDQKRKIIEVAQSQINYREGVNNATKYGAWYGMDHQPWCAMFVSWCAAQAGISEKIIPKLAYVPYMVEWFKTQKRYRGKKLYWPCPGDIIFFGDSSHVGLVESVSGNTIVTIEGNTSRIGNSSNGDGVYRRYRNIADPWIMGYATPDYKEDKMEAKNIKIDIRSVDGKIVDTAEVTAVRIDNTFYIRLRDLPEIFSGVEIDYIQEEDKPIIVLPVETEELLEIPPDDETKMAAREALATLANIIGV